MIMITKNTLNIPFGGPRIKETHIEQYIQHLAEAMVFLKQHQIDYLIIAFGGDTYKDDPDVSQHSRCGLEVKDYHTIGKYIKLSLACMDKKTKIIITQEGGYDLEHIALIVESFLDGLQTSD